MTNKRYVVWQPEEDQILITTHATMTSRQQAERLGRTHGSVRQRRAWLRQHGFISDATRAYNREWTADEEAEIAALLAQGYSVPHIAKKIRRSVSAIYERQRITLARNQEGAQVRSANAAAHLFGVQQPTLVSWIKRGWLKARRNRAHTGHKRGARPEYLITDEDIMAFIDSRETWPAWEAKWISDPDWRVYADDVRRAARGRWMTVKEVAARFHVALTTVLSWQARGAMDDVATVMYMQRFFWSADIERYQPIDRRKKAA